MSLHNLPGDIELIKEEGLSQALPASREGVYYLIYLSYEREALTSEIIYGQKFAICLTSCKSYHRLVVYNMRELMEIKLNWL